MPEDDVIEFDIHKCKEINSNLLIEITMKLKSDKAFAERMARYMRLSDEGKKYADNSIDLMYLKEHQGED